jgi:predicted transcriptional regulator/transcriptional regulator with XRE-family HTH domain
MPRKTSAPRRHALTGSRIRERRGALGLRQSDLAKAAGISASYLNLIEHNKRRIGGKLLLDLARALEVEPARLSEGMDASLSDMVQAAARAPLAQLGPPAELDRMDEFAGRFPGWTGVVAAQQKRIADLEAAVEGLQDRLAHDPVLAGSMHEVLSTVAAVRATSDILVREPDLEATWRARFHRNLHEEAERLSASATALLRHFERTEAQTGLVATPQEMVEAAFDAAGHHFAALEVGGVGAIGDVVAAMERLGEKALALAERRLKRYTEDAARLPLAPFLEAASAADFDPGALLDLAGGDVALVLRRLASLPEGGPAAVPGFGLAICDGAGALVFRRRIPAFSIPRYGAGCALWPLYSALARPMVPEVALLEQPDGSQFRAWAVAYPVGVTAFGTQPVMQATMLLCAISDTGVEQAARAVGPGCELCPRDDCAARRVDASPR